MTRPPGRPLRLVVGACEHEHGAPVLRHAAERAADTGAELVVVHLWRPPSAVFQLSAMSYNLAAYSAGVTAACEQSAFEQAVTVLGDAGCRWRYLALGGPVARQLAAVATAVSALAVVVGEPARRLPPRRARTVAAALRRAGVPVVAVPHPPPAHPGRRVVPHVATQRDRRSTGV